MQPKDRVLRLAALKLIADHAHAVYEHERKHGLGADVVETGQDIAAVLPDGTRVAKLSPRYSGSESLAQVVNPQAFTAYVKENYPHNIVESVIGSFQSLLLNRCEATENGEAVDAATGEVVPGVGFTSKEATAYAALTWTPKAANRAKGDALLLEAILSGAVPPLTAADVLELES